MARRLYTLARERHEDAYLPATLALAHLTLAEALAACCRVSLPLWPAHHVVAVAPAPAPTPDATQAAVAADVSTLFAKDGPSGGPPPPAVPRLRPNLHAAPYWSPSAVGAVQFLTNGSDDVLWDMVLISIIVALALALVRRQRLNAMA